ncbi:Glucosamine-phosphate N-acetyltransferase-like protein [Ascosphaera atra]|nr:Glucosamine-phosphate N-acetyltransferase-like protein [Ascosphaera atra]
MSAEAAMANPAAQAQAQAAPTENSLATDPTAMNANPSLTNGEREQQQQQQSKTVAPQSQPTQPQPHTQTQIPIRTATERDQTLDSLPQTQPLSHPHSEQEPPVPAARVPSGEPIFPLSYISPEVQSLLPHGYTCRPLHRSDYHNNYLDVLRVLTTVGDFTYEAWSQRYDWMAKHNEEYFPLVITDDTGKIVGTGTLIVEKKFIHGLGQIGHIEDIAVDTTQQGKKLGLRVIQALKFVGQKIGCYKTILDCSEHNEGFYIKCGFKRAGLEMAHYY